MPTGDSPPHQMGCLRMSLIFPTGIDGKKSSSWQIFITFCRVNALIAEAEIV